MSMTKLRTDFQNRHVVILRSTEEENAHLCKFFYRILGPFFK
jgi:hypothetical protein